MTRPLTDLFRPDFDRRPLAQRPFVIAEAGVNHEGSLDLALRHVDSAAAGGADAIKFQTYKADALAMRDSPAYWDLTQEPTTSQYELFRRYDSFGQAEYVALKARCDAVGIMFMSTPFDAKSAVVVNELVDVHKISSSDLTNRPFVEQIAAFGKPILLSTGASDLAEIRRAVSWIEGQGAPVALLHCVLNYPTPEANAALGRIVALRNEFPNRVVGYSDHTVPNDLEALVVAAALGASVIEKHFTHDRTLPGNDHYHALDEAALRRLVERLERATNLVGGFDLAHVPSEEVSRRQARRSIVAATDLPEGTVLEARHLTWKRPAHGISPAEMDRVVGRRTKRSVPADAALSWDDLA